MWGSRCIVGLRLLKSLNASLRLLSTRPGPGPGPGLGLAPGPGPGLRIRNPSLRLLSPALPAGSCFLSTGPGPGPGPGPGSGLGPGRGPGPGLGSGPGPGLGLRSQDPSFRLLSPALPAGSCFLSTGPGPGPGSSPGLGLGPGLGSGPGPGPGLGPGLGLRSQDPSFRLLSPTLPVGSCFMSTGPGPGPGLRFRTRLAVALALGGAVLASWGLVHREKQQRLRRERVEQLKKGILGKGNFSLLDQRGLRRTKEDFLGSWVLVYFGFTHCPDICPEELDKLTNVVLDLDRDPDLPRVQPVFITVDPDRDHVEAVARYLQDFHPRMVGLTGTPQEVREAGRDYRVYASPGPKDEDGDYIVDHTVLIYLVSPDGLFLDYYNRTKDQDQITKSVRNHIKTYVPLEDQD